MGFPIICINVNITIDPMLKFDAHVEANINIDDQCEWDLKTSQNYLAEH